MSALRIATTLWLLCGAAATLLLASAVVVLTGSRHLRRLSIPGIVAAVVWWLDTVLLASMTTCAVPRPVGAPVCQRGRLEYDIITIAYSSQEVLIVLVLILAVFASLLAYLSLRRKGRAARAPVPATAA